MTKLPYYHVDAFADRPFTGNQAAVMPLEQWLDEDILQAIGEENNLKLRVYGEKASLEWSQQEPNTLWLKFPDQPTQMLRSGLGSLSPLTLANLRTPAGHPEGYIEAFANLYVNFAAQVQAKKSNQT